MQEEQNNFLYSIVNAFSLEEFKKYTNFPDIVAVLKTNTPMDTLVDLNFKKNIPNKELWIAGGFLSLKLTDNFYGSATATRIFRNVYGIKRCSVVLNVLEEEVDRSDILECTVKKKRPKLPTKYPRKKMTSNNHKFPVTAGAGIYARKKDRSKTKTNSIGSFQLGPLKEKRMKNWSEWSDHEPMTVIPFENVACYLDRSEIQKYYRKMFDHELDRVKSQFEEYLEVTDLSHFSLSDFWHRYLRMARGYDVCGTEIAPIVEPESVSDMEESMEIYYPHFDTEVEVHSSPDNQCSLTAFPNDNNNRPSCKPTENESTNTDDLPSSSQLADVSRKIVFGEENGRATKRASSTETLIFEKRRRSSDYQQEYFHFLGL